MLCVNVIGKPPEKQNTATNYSLRFDFNECFDCCVFFYYHSWYPLAETNSITLKQWSVENCSGNIALTLKI